MMNLFATDSQVIPILVQLCVILVLPAVLVITSISYIIKQILVVVTKHLYPNIVAAVGSEDILYLDFNSLHKPYSAIPVVYRLQSCPTKEEIIQNFSSIYSKVRFEDGAQIHWKLSVYPVQKFGFWFWAKDEKFNFENQVQFLSSRLIDSEDEICSLVSKVMRQRFQDKRPLWDITVVPYTTTQGGSVIKSILIFRVSHSVIDGLSFIKLYYRLAGYDRLPPDFPVVTSKGKLNFGQLALEWAHAVFTGMYVYSCLKQKLPDCNSMLNLEVYKPSGEWILTSFPTIPLIDLKRTKIAFNCSINDIFLCGVFGGLQNYMKKYGNGICPSSIHCILAVPKPDHPNDIITNHLYSMIYEFPMNVKDRIERVKSIQKSMKDNVIRVNAINKFFQMFLAILNSLPISSYIESFTNFQGCTVQTSLVPSGNKTRLPPIFGAQVDVLQYWMPIGRGSAAAFTWGCITGNDCAWMTLTADSVWIKNKERLDELAKMIYSEFNVMCSDESLKVFESNEESR